MSDHEDSGKHVDMLFGEIAVDLDLVDPKELLYALNIQQKRRRANEPCPRIGEILVEIGFLKPSDVEKILRAGRPKKKNAPMSELDAGQTHGLRA